MDSLPKILQKSNAKRIYAITTYPNYISLIIITKNKDTFTNTTITILTHIWKTRNRLQFYDTIIPTTNTIIDIKNDLKSIIQPKKHNTDTL